MTGAKGNPLRMTIEFDPGSRPIVGWLQREEGPRQEFEGMLELISLLEDVRRAAEGPSG